MEARGLSAIPSPNDPYGVYDQPVGRSQGNSFLPGFLRNLKQDDIILIVVIILLLTDSGLNDKLLIGVLVFLFLSGLEGNIFSLL